MSDFFQSNLFSPTAPREVVHMKKRKKPKKKVTIKIDIEGEEPKTFIGSDSLEDIEEETDSLNISKESLSQSKNLKQFTEDGNYSPSSRRQNITPSPSEKKKTILKPVKIRNGRDGDSLSLVQNDFNCYVEPNIITLPWPEKIQKKMGMTDQDYGANLAPSLDSNSDIKKSSLSQNINQFSKSGGFIPPLQSFSGIGVLPSSNDNDFSVMTTNLSQNINSSKLKAALNTNPFIDKDNINQFLYRAELQGIREEKNSPMLSQKERSNSSLSQEEDRSKSSLDENESLTVSHIPKSYIKCHQKVKNENILKNNSVLILNNKSVHSPTKPRKRTTDVDCQTNWVPQFGLKNKDPSKTKPKKKKKKKRNKIMVFLSWFMSFRDKFRFRSEQKDFRETLIDSDSPNDEPVQLKTISSSKSDFEANRKQILSFFRKKKKKSSVKKAKSKRKNKNKKVNFDNSSSSKNSISIISVIHSSK